MAEIGSVTTGSRLKCTGPLSPRTLTTRLPGFDLPRGQWLPLNRFRTGYRGACRKKRDLTDNDMCTGHSRVVEKLVWLHSSLLQYFVDSFVVLEIYRFLSRNPHNVTEHTLTFLR